MQFHRQFIVAAALTAALAPALAQENTVKLGAARIQLHDSTTGVTGIGVPPGANLDVHDASTVVFSFEHRLTPQFGIEFALGIPPKHDVYASGSVAFLGLSATVKQLAPTLFANYHFGEPGAVLRPYVGAGLNVTRFYGEESRYGQHIQLSDSHGLALQAGVDYSLSGPWSLFASVAAARVKSNLVATATTVQRTTIDFKPVVFELGVGYSF